MSPPSRGRERQWQWRVQVTLDIAALACRSADASVCLLNAKSAPMQVTATVLNALCGPTPTTWSGACTGSGLTGTATMVGTCQLQATVRPDVGLATGAWAAADACCARCHIHGLTAASTCRSAGNCLAHCISTDCNCWLHVQDNRGLVVGVTADVTNHPPTAALARPGPFARVGAVVSPLRFHVATGQCSA